MPLRRLEPEQLAGSDVRRLAARRDTHRPFDDRDPRVLLHLVLAELLTGCEHDEDGTRTVVLCDDDGVTRALRRGDREQVPVLHASSLDSGRCPSSTASSCPRTSPTATSSAPTAPRRTPS